MRHAALLRIAIFDSRKYGAPVHSVVKFHRGRSMTTPAQQR
jgi:hypothetical protein